MRARCWLVRLCRAISPLALCCWPGMPAGPPRMCLHLAPTPSTPACVLQHNVELIESNLGRLEERLGHEKEKFAQFDIVLKEHEQR